jgi:hypothetical protein
VLVRTSEIAGWNSAMNPSDEFRPIAKISKSPELRPFRRNSGDLNGAHHQNCNNLKVIITFFFDIKKAFEKVWHEAILAEMASLYLFI